MTNDSTTSEENEPLWLLAVSPGIWFAHFLASYLSAAVWCARAGRVAGLAWVRPAIGIFTLVALAGIVYMGWQGLQRHRLGRSSTPHDIDTAADRHRFIGFATVLLSGLSVVGVIYVALPAVFFVTCM